MIKNMKTVLITGISRGLGMGLAKKFLEENYFVIGTSTSGNGPLLHNNLIIIQLDLSKPEIIKNCVLKITDTKRKIDILINNAAVLQKDGKNNFRVDNLRGVLEVNLIGTIDFTEQIIPLMNEGGHIVNISSTAGSLSDYSAMPYSYSISKAALNMYTKTLSDRLNLTVSSVHPGVISKDVERSFKEKIKNLIRLMVNKKNAEISPQKAVKYVYSTAISKVKTGQFWFQNKKIVW